MLNYVMIIAWTLFAPTFNGATLSFHGEGKNIGRSYDEILVDMAQAGANSVSMVIEWEMESVNASEVEAPTDLKRQDALISRVAKRARGLNFSRMLLPILKLRKTNKDEWRGALRPNQKRAFWGSYKRFILHYAKVAQSEGIELLCIGSELSSLESETQSWRELIRAVRSVYSGNLVYSANWDHFWEIDFWGELDFVGISGYFELTDNTHASELELARAWSNIKIVLVDWLSPINKPLIFTELGYPSRDGGAVRPWDYTSDTPLDLEEQRRALAAFRRTWQREPSLAGVYFWNWWGPADGKNKWYTIPGKPGRKEVEAFFKARRL